uniref:cytosolic sulfotransferase 3-like n=1 Tax=Ciona intestinalis TaxID=7719 RepID=UPI0002B8D5CC|nr:cytosolic sulfotransferase 3-like [Ciona intestinalis]|eukprot:XP_002127351.2 cytosolic sulfotransferase 3-like [Ciona intestinalis]
MTDNEKETLERNLNLFFGEAFEDIAQYATDPPDVQPVVDYFVNDGFMQPKLTEWKGYKMYGIGFNMNTVKWVYENWTPWKDDVIVASFQKIGTTWASYIVRQLYFRHDEKLMAMTKNMAMPTIYLETGLPVKFELLEKLPWKKRVLATHVPTPLLNLEKIKSAGAKIICTIRNPKDQMVSWYHMTLKFPMNPNATKYFEMYPKDWNHFFDLCFAGKQLLGNKKGEWYMEHLLSWYPHRNDSNVLFVFYEDLIQYQEREIKRIADFLGVAVSDQDVSSIAKETSFESLKEKSNASEKLADLFRKGKVGDWKNYFTVAQSEKMDALVKEKLADTDIKFIYEL